MGKNKGKRPGAFLLRRYNNWGIGGKMLFCFVVGALIPILVLQTISYGLNTRYMTQKVDELMVSNLSQVAERVELTLQVYTNLLYQIYVDESITESLDSLLDSASTRKAAAYNRIVGRFKQYENATQGIRCLAVICTDGTSVVYDFGTGSSLDTLWRGQEDLRQIAPYQSAVDQSGMVITPTMRFAEKRGDAHLFHISKRLFDLKHLARGTIATVVMSVEEEVLGRICHTGNEDYSITFILDEARHVVSYPDAFFSGISIAPNLTVREFVNVSGLLRGKDTAVNAYEHPATGWTLCNVYDKRYMLKDVDRSQRVFILLGAGAALFSTLLILYTRRAMVASVGEVLAGMQKVRQGDLDVEVPVRAQDEIGRIAASFNDMTRRVRQLIEEVRRATGRQKNAEIRALEAQINPHFLYNTLDSINWMAIEHEEYEISRMLRDLGFILRYSVSGSNQCVPVWQAGDWLEKYIGLYRMRFDNAFEFQLTILPAAREKKLRKLLLQPFIENAILHGFKGVEAGGLLCVDIGLRQEDGLLQLIIEDNGAGMPPAMVAQFNDRGRAVRDEGGHIGLHNAFARMQMYYGERAQWHISSMAGLGTVITLLLPPEGGDAVEEGGGD